MDMLNPMMTTDVAGNPCWMRPGGWTQVGILKTRGCMGSVVKPHKWLLLKRPWEFVKELFRTYLVAWQKANKRAAAHGERVWRSMSEQVKKAMDIGNVEKRGAMLELRAETASQRIEACNRMVEHL